MPCGGEHGHVGAGFGDEDLRDGGAEPRDAHEELPGETKGLHRRLDPGAEVVDVGGVGVNPVQIEFGHVAVVFGEPAGECLGEFRDFGPQPALGHLRQGRRVGLPVDECLEDQASGDPGDVRSYGG